VARSRVDERWQSACHASDSRLTVEADNSGVRAEKPCSWCTTPAGWPPAPAGMMRVRLFEAHPATPIRWARRRPRTPIRPPVAKQAPTLHLKHECCLQRLSRSAYDPRLAKLPGVDLLLIHDNLPPPSSGQRCVVPLNLVQIHLTRRHRTRRSRRGDQHNQVRATDLNSSPRGTDEVCFGTALTEAPADAGKGWLLPRRRHEGNSPHVAFFHDERGSAVEVDAVRHSAQSSSAASLTLSAMCLLVAATGFAYLAGRSSPTALTLQIAVFLAMCIGTAFYAAKLLRRGRGGVALGVVVIGIIFWIGLPALTYFPAVTEFPIRRGTLVSEIEDFQAALLGWSAFLLSVLIGYLLSPTGLRRRQFTVRGFGRVDENGRHVLAISMVLALVAFAFYLALSGSPNSMVQSALSGRGGKPWSSVGNYGTYLTPAHNAAQAAHVLSAGLAGVLITNRGLRHKLSAQGALLVIAAVIIGVFAGAWVVLESGTRATLLQLSMPALVLLTTHRIHRSVRLILVGLVAVSLMLALASFQRSTRDSGLVGRENLSSDFTVQIQDNDFLEFTAHSFSFIRSGQGSTQWDSPLFGVAAGPIPRVLWPGKPEPTATYDLSSAARGYDVRARGGNIIPGLVGQYFMSLSWLGVTWIGLLFGLVARTLDYTLQRESLERLSLVLFTGIAAGYLFVSLRGITFGWLFPVYVAGGLYFYLNRRSTHRQADLAVGGSSCAKVPPQAHA
jgi:hypothetical protein